MRIERLDFKTIEDVWKTKLWTNRTSPIETHSAMTWPFEGNPEPIDMNIFNIIIYVLLYQINGQEGSSNKDGTGLFHTLLSLLCRLLQGLGCLHIFA